MEREQAGIREQLIRIDGAPCATKAARTVRRGGKSVLTTISGDMAKAADYLSQSGVEPCHRKPCSP